ncbi:hypothetical protein BH11PLA2_BH11PLA2_50360 [soil metagenome]
MAAKVVKFLTAINIRMDPRVTTTADGLEKQFKLSMECYEGMTAAGDALSQIGRLRKQLGAAKAKFPDLGAAINAVDEKWAALERAADGGGRRGGKQPGSTNLRGTASELGRLLAILQGADATPTSQATAAVAEAKKELDGLLTRWVETKQKDLAELNVKLKAASLPAIIPSEK